MERTVEMPYKVMLIALKAAIDIAEATGGEVTMARHILRSKVVQCLQLLAQSNYDKQLFSKYIDDIIKLLHPQSRFKDGGYVGKSEHLIDNRECIINRK